VTHPVPLGEAERAGLQRRTLRVLVTGQIIGAAALAAAVTVGAFVIQDILGDDTPWGGIATATVTTGTAVASHRLSRLMTRRGRRPGLQLGYLLAAVGAFVAAAGAESSRLPIFIVGLFLFGNGQASNLLARYAATDLASPDARARAMSRIVFSSTFGAVFGPLLIQPAQNAGTTWFGFGRYTGPWMFSGAVLLVAFVNVALRLRPDPLVVSGGIAPRSEGRLPSIRAALSIAGGTARGRLALTSMVVSQAAMVAVMTMTPVHMKIHGHETLSQYVVSLHIAGMFAFSPLVGRYVDRRGTLQAVWVGSIILVASTILAALSGTGHLVLFPSLWMLGVGWNFGLIGGSAMLLESVAESDRVAVQGSADLLMSLCGGLAGLSSGFVRRAVGYHMLSNAATLAGVALLVAAYLARQHATNRPVVAG